MSQTSYTEEQRVAIPGQLADIGPNSKITRVNGEASAVDFGIGVVQSGSEAREFLLPPGNIDDLVGVVIHQHDNDNRALANDLGVDVDEPATVLVRGRVYVEPEVDVVPGDAVFLRHTDNGPLTVGHWRNDADTAAALEVKHAQWRTAGGPTSGNPAVLDLGLPGQ